MSCSFGEYSLITSYKVEKGITEAVFRGFRGAFLFRNSLSKMMDSRCLRNHITTVHTIRYRRSPVFVVCVMRCFHIDSIRLFIESFCSMMNEQFWISLSGSSVVRSVRKGLFDGDETRRHPTWQLSRSVACPCRNTQIQTLRNYIQDRNLPSMAEPNGDERLRLTPGSCCEPISEPLDAVPETGPPCSRLFGYTSPVRPKA
jgi:hypothetical protein